MIPVYATRLTIMANSEHPSETLLDDCVATCYSWLRHVAQKQSNLPLPDDPLQDIEIASPSTGSEYVTEHFSYANDRCWQAVGIHPFSDSPHHLIRTEIQIRDASPSEIDVTFRLLLKTATDMTTPNLPVVRTPGLVFDLLETFPAMISSGNLKASAVPSEPSSAEVTSDLIVDKILNPARLVPIVVISRLEDGSLPVSRKMIQYAARKIATLGRIYVLPDPASSFTLINVLSKPLSTYRGSIRIYWPGFSIADSPYRHQLWTAERIRAEGLTQYFPEALYEIVGSAAARTIGSDSIVERIHRLAEAEHHERQLTELRASHATAKGELQTLLNHRARLEAELDQQRQFQTLTQEQLQDREQELESVRLALTGKEQEWDQRVLETASALIEADRRASELRIKAAEDYFRTMAETKQDAADDAILEAAKWGCSHQSIGDIVEKIANHSNEAYLLILPEALDAARRTSNLSSIPAFFETLMTVREVARRYHAHTIQSHRSEFQKLGEPQFSSTTRETMNRFSSDYRRTYSIDGKPETAWCGYHIHSGGQGNSTGVSVYWHIDEDRRRYIIGHIGSHQSVKTR